MSKWLRQSEGVAPFDPRRRLSIFAELQDWAHPRRRAFSRQSELLGRWTSIVRKQPKNELTECLTLKHKGHIVGGR